MRCNYSHLLGHLFFITEWLTKHCKMYNFLYNNASDVLRNKLFSRVVVVSPGKFNFHHSDALLPEIDFRPLLERMEKRKMCQVFQENLFCINAIIDITGRLEYCKID